MRNYGCDEARLCIGKGVNGRLDELQAAILRVLLRELDLHTKERCDLAAEYRVLFAAHAAILPPSDAGAVYHQFAITPPRRDEVRARLSRQHGIATGIHYSPGVHRHPHFFRPDIELPVTDQLAAQLLSLPIQPEVVRERMGAIAEAVLESLHACR